MADISQLVKSAGIDAKRTAVETFGMAVEDFAGTPINDYLRTVSGQNETAQVNRNDGSWYASSYAASLANSKFRPKLKFLFRVEFLFDDKVAAQFGISNTQEWKRNFTFLIKSVDRPKVDFEYEEINQYNFRTKVLKAIKHRELTMTFMDDVGNNVYEFFRFMMMVHSPITRRSANASQDIAKAYTAYTGSGMEFTNEFGNVNDFAHRGTVNTALGNVIKAIKVTQFWLNNAEAITSAAHQVSFFFINPRVVSFDLDDVNHETSDPNLFTMQFDYDFMVMSKNDALEKLDASKKLPPVGSAPGDAGPPANSSQSSQGGNNPYSSILTGAAGRATQKLSSETIGRVVRQVPGLGSVAGTISGISGNMTKNFLTKGINQAFARPTRGLVVDNSTVGADSATYATASGSFGPGQPGVDTEA